MTARQWLEAYARRLGVDAPTTEEFNVLLDLAAEAAHSSERVAAPVACWLAARAQRSPDGALDLAREIAGAQERE
ncbi:MAG: hypothetical protein JOZ25_09750 [Actinobacteria bacterium]|nr:hypothetical protein [Actinomycetota bacterium]